ncbi:arginine decarboxylase [Alcanivorax balearicus MACL04]|uniref:Arginine decarboxylase n=1 Tax=Alloalcanivorax balearicus MACL04 TaxID=1177182 RepID=A0ABT2QT60_9GAMM|nr:biosynthetic arginine decarboxylase [Alloalcanivorax balearicus]MCU5780714.1 arginine decarboxylase [Alloalcanivorax balearicus MACL04]
MSTTPERPFDAIYNVDRWGDGYFRIDDRGRLCVRPQGGEGAEAPLETVLEACRQAGLRPPVLARFSGILKDRVRRLSGAFAAAIEDLRYRGEYTPVYPIKVNQQRRVVHEIIRAREDGDRVGLEAGSKPELLAVLALSNPGDTVVCNGYKDREYLRLALMGQTLGFKVHIVVEKLSELPLLLEEADRIGVEPIIGLRVRLMNIGKGNWQNTGGEKSKFGLSAPQLIEAVAHCRDAGKLSCVRMLHFHLGSQVANIQDIKAGMREAARYYVELRGLGAPVDTVDVGGGLGVDYEGTHSRSYCSMNYGVADYAWHIVHTLAEQCATHNLPHPDVISESGRALTAHHAVLLLNITDEERQTLAEVAPPGADDSVELHELWRLNGQLERGEGNLLELYPELMGAWQDLQLRYLNGDLGIVERARAEQLYVNALLRLRQRLDPRRRQQRELLDQLNERLADKLFVNFSVFQSVPDVWGIDQVFPVLPLSGLDQPATRRGVLQDITCDSDGRIDQYVDGEGVESSLPLPETLNGHLGIFMVGAYQEILGDMHNLFGDTDSVDVTVTENGDIELAHAIQGDTVSTVLRYVNFDPQRLLETLENRCRDAHLDESRRQAFLNDIRDGLAGYTYLE